MTLPGWVTRGVGGLRWPDHEVARVQRRTLSVLVVAQSLGGVGITIGIAVASILAEDLSGSESLAGLAQTGQVLGAAVASFLLAHLMGRRGRRPGLVLGYAIGAVGAALAVVAGVVESFVLLIVGATLLGATTAANNQSRYTATDLARPERRARALSLVVWATTIGAVAGPNLTGVAGRTARQLGIPGLTGPFVFGFVGILAAGVVVAVFLRPDPLLVARQAAMARGAAPVLAGTSWGRVRQVLRERPAVRAGVAALSLAHGVMIAVMVMTPLHMHHGGAHLQLIGLVISVHVLGMFALAPLVGWAADRFGRPPMLTVGAGVLFLALLLSGMSPPGASWTIGVGLFLLGLGWSFCTVAASTLVTESSPLDARTDVQGAADLVMGVTAALAGVVAGLVMDGLGYVALNVFAALLVTGVATAAELARRTAGRSVGSVGGPLL
ncbi:MFS transporter [Nocardioides iriomotensis]|uniref:MFS transporter n=1 Tax=Nocardioides iriomotensis TaxID=715784 RepID=A0A4Q5J1L6_9ACTN|nr:MFS transporter [Nocardioides iriomotensis]RYU12467.1 MFS transporter [Nocardioides iriomotensis]